uniref:Uncharacterized protein n=1 Tax=Mola mola TaxID=94237 RepID=A0A3Q3WTK3_MOLML
MRKRISSWTRPEPRTPPPIQREAKSTCTHTHIHTLVGHPSESKVGHPSESKVGHPSESEVGHPSESKVGHPSESKVVHPSGSKVVHPSDSEVSHPSEMKMVHPFVESNHLPEQQREKIIYDLSQLIYY